MLAFRDAAIGVFDSGVGGLTVVKSLTERLPLEQLVYLGDTARIPYGTKSPETVERYAIQVTRFLESMGVKMLVIACNTASALALQRLKDELHIPVIGVIQPGAKQAVRKSESGRIGVIATEATVLSGAYERAIRSFKADAEVTTKACPLFVAFAEEGWHDHEEATALVAHKYLDSLKEQGVDTLVLGCTHYPILRPVIAEVMGPDVKLIESGEAVADEVAAALAERDLLRVADEPAPLRFYVTDTADRFRRVAERFLDGPLEHVEAVDVR